MIKLLQWIVDAIWYWNHRPDPLDPIQREWLKKYGDSRGILRDIGPLGTQRVIFLSNQAMHKIMVSDCMEAALLAQDLKDGYWIWPLERHRRCAQTNAQIHEPSFLVEQLDRSDEPLL